MKNIGLGLMILGLGFMVVTYIQTDNFNNILLGLVIVSIGSLLNQYGKKKAEGE